MPLNLTSKEASRLRELYQAGQLLEAKWNDADLNSRATLIQVIANLLEEFATSENLLLSKIYELHRLLKPDMQLNDLMSFLVPIERLLQRGLADSEWLYQESDREFSLKPSGPVRVVALENLRSAFNIGSIYRTAECFGVQEIWSLGYTADSKHPAVAKSAMGTESLLTERRLRDFSALKELAIEKKLPVIGLEVDANAISAADFKWPEEFVLVLGNERFGLDVETRKACDHLVQLPLSGSKNSLNVGVAFGAALALANQKTPAIEPIGFLRANGKTKQSAPRQPLANSSKTETIELKKSFKSQPSNFKQALIGLSEFNRIWLIWNFDQTTSYRPMIKPPNGPEQKVGVFATRAPHRPNPIGISCVRLLKIEDDRLIISESDLLPDTPIWDIKPYVTSSDSFFDAKQGWIGEIESHRYTIEFATDLSSKVTWLKDSASGGSAVIDFINEQLKSRPLDADRKRIEILKESDSFTEAQIAYRYFRIDYRVDKIRKHILILKIELAKIELDLNDLEISEEELKLLKTFKNLAKV